MGVKPQDSRSFSLSWSVAVGIGHRSTCFFITADLLGVPSKPPKPIQRSAVVCSRLAPACWPLFFPALRSVMPGCQLETSLGGIIDTVESSYQSGCFFFSPSELVVYWHTTESDYNLFPTGRLLALPLEADDHQGSLLRRATLCDSPECHTARQLVLQPRLNWSRPPAFKSCCCSNDVCALRQVT